MAIENSGTQLPLPLASRKTRTLGGGGKWSQPTFFFVATLLATIIVSQLCLAVFEAFGQEPWFPSERLGFLGFAVGGLIFVMEYARKRDIFAVPCFMSLIFLAYFGFGYFLTLWNLRDGWLQFATPEETLRQAEWFAISAFLCWYIGYKAYLLLAAQGTEKIQIPECVTWGRRLRAKEIKWTLLVLGVSLGAFFFFAARSGLPGFRSGSVASRFEAVAGVGWLVLVIYWIVPVTLVVFFDWFAGSKVSFFKLLLAVLYFGASGIFLFATGTRGMVILFVLVFLGMVHYLLRRLTLPNIAILAVGAVLLVGLLGLFRLGVSENDGFWSLGTFLRVDLFNNISGFADVLETVPDSIPYENGSTFVGVIAYLVPRALWVDKPITSAGALYKIARDAEFGGGGIGLTFFGELYWNWGVVAIFVGMFFFGLVCAWLWKWFRRSRRDSWHTTVYLFTLISFALLLPGESTLVLNLILQWLLPLWLFKLALRLRFKPRY